jgi:hypothetical protein
MTRRHALRLTGALAAGSVAGPRAPLSADEAAKPFPWIGRKFAADGRVLPFPGNTFICPIAPSNPATAPLRAFRAALEAEPYAHKFAFTPPSSYHMTVFEGVVDQVRKPGFWPADLDPDAPLADCNRLFLRKLAAFNLEDLPRFRMAVMEGPGNVDMRPGAGIYLSPLDDRENARLRRLRDRLSDLLALRHRGTTRTSSTPPRPTRSHRSPRRRLSAIGPSAALRSPPSRRRCRSWSLQRRRSAYSKTCSRFSRSFIFGPVSFRLVHRTRQR